MCALGLGTLLASGWLVLAKQFTWGGTGYYLRVVVAKQKCLPRGSMVISGISLTKINTKIITKLCG